MKKYFIVFLTAHFLFNIPGSYCQQQKKPQTPDEHPKIVNIINFIRLLEPRDAKITQDVLFQTVVKQWQMMRKYNLKGTFLLQYDALMDPRYQKFLKSLGDSVEIGGWWEIPQPLVEKAGMKWRGRYPWDWYANVGFSTGYTPPEREKLIDVYMDDFKKIFGRYPGSVGSWFIDAHSLDYMYDKYHIIASCNCKDQVGTDGYTLWGGYWNQAYYPSRINSYMPAQDEKSQLPVPVFRMLGSDPVRQYDMGLGSARQGVITLEPVYRGGGGNEKWVSWFFREFTEGACMEFAYVQAGQENSFTWNSMAKGYAIQMPLIASLRDQNKVKVETLAETGQWFKDHYKVTPAASVTVNNDFEGSNKKTVWFNSRFFRINIIWEDSTLRIRDIHLFNENFPSAYTRGVTTTNQASFFTLPFVDGYLWSKPQKIAGLRLKTFYEGTEISIKGGAPVISDSIPHVLHIRWPLRSFKGNLIMDITEAGLDIKMEGIPRDTGWYFEMSAADNAALPYTEISPMKAECRFEGMDYSVKTTKGSFSKRDKAFLILPDGNEINLRFDNR